VSADASGGIVAASVAKGGLITYWDVGARKFLGSCELNDGCGIAPTRHKASFLLTSGQGWLVETDVTSGQGWLVETDVRATPAEVRRSSPYEWDNHAILVG
jgi:hypothetical protein